ncbi:MAG TPA: hypothetical protein VMJ64_16875 [Anaerolineales bacterium]|nr:hypothetical protein [Anaerolineales bacterium]
MVNFEHIGTLPGSPQPKDLFEPCMPEVDVLSDIEGFFAYVREMLTSEDLPASAQAAELQQLVHEDIRSLRAVKGQRYVAIITPGRIVSLSPSPLPNTKTGKELAPLRSLLGTDQPLQITAISYTRLEAYLEDRSKTKCIPFLGLLLGFAYLGHSVLVFEGHPSALAAGVKGSDLVIIDSGMLPFLPADWPAVVFPVLKPKARLFIHERKTFALTPITRKDGPPGWQRSEPDGEASYINMLLTTLGKSNHRQSVWIRPSNPAPDPKQFTTERAQLAYLSRLPFQYDRLKVDVIIKTLWNLGKPDDAAGDGADTRIFRAKLAESGRMRDIAFLLRLWGSDEGKQSLEIRLQ